MDNKKLCSFEDCDTFATTRGWCRTHYSRWRIHGDPSIIARKGPKSRTFEERFNSIGWTVVESGCWIWNGKPTRYGYGQIKKGDTMVKTHRVSYEMHKGPIPEGLFVCHSCDVRLCINPEHLWLGTCADNQKDMVEKGRALTGSRNPQAKLTLEDVENIRVRVASGEIQRRVAEDYGISYPHVSDIVNNQRWKTNSGKLDL